jgi:arylsulfatase A-like enzyme
MNAICLVFDRLHTGYLGAYGNTWIETPAVDRLASQSFLFDQALIDTPDLSRLYHSYWQGCHALCAHGSAHERPTLAATLREAGVSTALATDEPLVARHPLAADFDEIIELDPPLQYYVAEEIDRTHFARCFLEIINWLQAAPKPFMLWCHLAGLGTIWDAPLSFRRAYREEGDPDPPSGAEVPERIVTKDHDPDELLGFMHCYAGQVSLLDSCLEAFGDFLGGLTAAEELLLAITSSRGFPLGEHGRIGPCDEALYGELVQVPLMLRFADGRGAAARSQMLVGAANLWATFLHWWQKEPVPSLSTATSLLPAVQEEVVAVRDRLCIAGSGPERAMRTPAWYLRLASEAELYVKPDDRWEVNNVSSRCQEVVEGLQEALVKSEKAWQEGKITDLPLLGDVLINGLA